MTNFQAARTNMVDSQIHTMGVVNEAILDAFRTVPREMFVPEGQRGIAYNDEDLPIGNGRCLMEPVTHARLIQAINPLASDTALDVGGVTGYSTAILASIVSNVVALEEEAPYLDTCTKLCASQGHGNVTTHQGNLAQGCANHAPYNLIVINGTVTAIPSALIQQLANGGRLVGIVKGRGDKIGKAVLIQKSESGVISDRLLFDAAVPYLPGFEPANEFVF